MKWKILLASLALAAVAQAYITLPQTQVTTITQGTTTQQINTAAATNLTIDFQQQIITATISYGSMQNGAFQVSYAVPPTVVSLNCNNGTVTYGNQVLHMSATAQQTCQQQLKAFRNQAEQAAITYRLIPGGTQVPW